MKIIKLLIILKINQLTVQGKIHLERKSKGNHSFGELGVFWDTSATKFITENI